GSGAESRLPVRLYRGVARLRVAGLVLVVALRQGALGIVVGAPGGRRRRLWHAVGRLPPIRAVLFARLYGRRHHRVRLVSLPDRPGAELASVASARTARRRDGD